MKFWESTLANQLLDIGKLTALIAIPYLIGKNRDKRQHFKFDFSNASGKFDKQTGYYHWEISGIIRNKSTTENSIVTIHRIVWKNNHKNSYLADSVGNISIVDLNSSGRNKLNLPLYFKSREAIRIQVSTIFIVKDTPDEKILSEVKEFVPGSKVFVPKYRYELLFEDIDENFFDHQGNLRNKEEADLWWTLPQFKEGNLISISKHLLLILVSKVNFKIKLLFWNIGL